MFSKKLISENGTSLISVLIAAGIFGFLAIASSQMFKNGMQGFKFIQFHQDLETIKMTIRMSLSCKKTLGITDATTLPLTCSGFPSITLKKHDGTMITTNGKLGDWEIGAFCRENRIIVTAAKDGKDPLTGRPFIEAPAAFDLFNGLSDLCYADFTDNTPRFSKIEYVTIPNLATYTNPGCNAPGGICFANGCNSIVGSSNVAGGELFNANSGCSRFCMQKKYVSGSMVECWGLATPNYGACLCVAEGY